MDDTKREDFVKEANRATTLDAVTEDAENMTEAEIIGALISGGFTEAKAWEIAQELKRN